MGVFHKRPRKSSDPLVAFPSADNGTNKANNKSDDASNELSTTSVHSTASVSRPRAATLKLTLKPKQSIAKLLDVKKLASTKQNEDHPPSPPPPLPLASAGSTFSDFEVVPSQPQELEEGKTEAPKKEGEESEQDPSKQSSEQPQQPQEPLPYVERMIYYRGPIPLHAYPPCEAPYMVSYGSNALQSDYYSTQLYGLLCPEGSPTFHNYGDNPPINVLDIGCGEGYWAADAATMWKASNVKIDMLDLVDISKPIRDALEDGIKESLKWTQGNMYVLLFTNHSSILLTDACDSLERDLPFAENSFDLVRLANMTMAIPFESWPHLLCSIRRVLKPDGRLEIVDDQLFFPQCQYPYDPEDDKCPPQCPPPKVCPRPSKKSNRVRVDSNRSSGSSEYHSATSQPSTNTHDEDEDDDVFLDRSPSPPPPPPPPKTGPFYEFEMKARNTRNLERVFEGMLKGKYKIAPQPHTFLRRLLQEIFGDGNFKRSHSFQVVVPTEDMELDIPSTDTTEKSKSQKTTEAGSNKRSFRSRGKPIAVEWEKKDKGKGKAKDTEKGTEQAKKSQQHLPLTAPSLDLPGPSSRPAGNSQTPFPIPDLPNQMSPKAARVLVGNTDRPRTTRPYQPAGIIVLPSTFIPCEPDVLEMHAFKNSHLLLACKFAMVRYADQYKTANGGPLLSPEDMDHFMWEYDSFRRRRMNWPQDYASVHFQDDECAADGMKSKLFGFLGANKDKESKEAKEPSALERRRGRGHSVSLPKAQLLHPIKRAGEDNNVVVRTIRVYEAIKRPPTVTRAVTKSKSKISLKAKPSQASPSKK